MYAALKQKGARARPHRRPFTLGRIERSQGGHVPWTDSQVGSASARPRRHCPGHYARRQHRAARFDAGRWGRQTSRYPTARRHQRDQGRTRRQLGCQSPARWPRRWTVRAPPREVSATARRCPVWRKVLTGHGPQRTQSRPARSVRGPVSSCMDCAARLRPATARALVWLRSPLVVGWVEWWNVTAGSPAARECRRGRCIWSGRSRTN
jgi:hypothetical protein